MIEPKRSLGQNFFVNENLAKKIVDTVLVENPELIVEIGPGHGYFSSLLQQGGKKLLLVEKDNTLAEGLLNHYPEQEVVNIDFLEWDFSQLEKFKGKKILFFGSLPYNVSKRIISKVIESNFFNMSAYFIIQKEVAEKYTANTPDTTFLSLKTEIYATCKKLFDISPESFKPKPKVVSSFVMFTPQEKTFFQSKEEVENFENFLLQAYKQPRKKLQNNLKGCFPYEIGEKAKELLNLRPQHLTIEDYLFLFSKRAK